MRSVPFYPRAPGPQGKPLRGVLRTALLPGLSPSGAEPAVMEPSPIRKTQRKEEPTMLTDMSHPAIDPDFPDKYCFTLPDGLCISTDPRCMCQPHHNPGLSSVRRMELLERCDKKHQARMLFLSRARGRREKIPAPHPGA